MRSQLCTALIVRTRTDYSLRSIRFARLASDAKRVIGVVACGFNLLKHSMGMSAKFLSTCKYKQISADKCWRALIRIAKYPGKFLLCCSNRIRRLGVADGQKTLLRNLSLKVAAMRIAQLALECLCPVGISSLCQSYIVVTDHCLSDRTHCSMNWMLESPYVTSSR